MALTNAEKQARFRAVTRKILEEYERMTGITVMQMRRHFAAEVHGSESPAELAPRREEG